MGSNPIPGTYLESTTGYGEYLKEVKRLAPTTVESKLRIIRRLQRRVNLWDTESFERYLLNAKMTNGLKESVGYAYQDWCKFNGFDYCPKRFKREEKLPHIPKESEIDQLISGCGGRLSCFLQLLKESACRPIEAWRLTSEDFDLKQKLCYINKPAKGSNPRILKMSDKLTAMVTRIVNETHPDSRLWKAELVNLRRSYQRRRKTLSQRLNDPNLNRISLRTFRHWKATIEYSKTKDILYVKRLLGHKRIENTLVYTHLIDFGEEDSFSVKIASTIEEFTTLLESGFEYVSDYEGKKILRKRK
jgi:integrase